MIWHVFQLNKKQLDKNFLAWHVLQLNKKQLDKIFDCDPQNMPQENIFALDYKK